MFVQLSKEFLGHPPGKRIDVAEEHGQLLIQRGIAEPLADDPLAPLVARTTEQVSRRLSEGINTALKQFADAQSQSQRLSRPLIFGDGPGGDPKKSFGDWLLHVARNDEPYLEKTYGTVRTKTAMAEASGSISTASSNFKSSGIL